MIPTVASIVIPNNANVTRAIRVEIRMRFSFAENGDYQSWFKMSDAEDASSILLTTSLSWKRRANFASDCR
jgi:hypothetical protein